MDLGKPVQEQVDKLDVNNFLSRHKINPLEKKLGHGDYHKPAITLFAFLNGISYAARNNLLKSRKFFFALFPVSYLFSYAVCETYFADKTLHDASIVSDDSQSSAEFFNRLTKNNH